MTVKELEILWKVYYFRFVMFAMRYVHQNDVAEDMVTDSFLKLFSQMEKIQQSTSSAWMYLTIRNTCIDHIRSQNRHSRIHNRLLKEAETVEYPKMEEESDQFMEVAIIKSEVCELLSEEMKKCTSRQQEIISLRIFEGMDTKNIANNLNISMDTVRTILFRFKHRLKNLGLHENKMKMVMLYLGIAYSKSGGEKRI